MSRRILRVRPARPLAPIVVAAAILGAWWLVAHNSGAGWVQVLGDIAFGTLAIGILGPSVVLARSRIRVRAGPVDSTAGLPAEFSLDASTRVRIHPVEPPGPDAFVGPVRRRAPASDMVALLPPRRGAYGAIVVDVATAAPFGLQWWTRRVVLALPSTWYVAPRRGQAVDVPMRSQGRTGDDRGPVVATGGEPRGARPYRPGDDRRHIHWPALAHTGELMVREWEGPTAEPTTVRVSLPPDPDDAERIAERALATVVGLIDRGAPVLLETVEASGRVLAAVEDRRTAGRRLALAQPRSGALSSGAPPAPTGIHVST